MSLPENRDDAMSKHEADFHAFDEDIRRALWGPLRKSVEGGGRQTQQGLVYQMQQLTNKSQKGFKLATSDKAIVALMVAVAETIRILWG